ncbi:MAG TPA: CRISPR-associated endoribonuclease Cas6 [Exilispira sp.]|nr:CRISPR-associated endoribonuclease Cas6 [Exilispira sp.]
MRFSCKIFLENQTEIPNNYRSHLISLIKESIKKSGDDGEQFYDRYYTSNNAKPFTFSTYIPSKRLNNINYLNGEYIVFFFSSYDYEFLIRVYNGLMKIKKYPFLSSKIGAIKDFNILSKKSFNQKAIFKTLSPFLVRNVENGDIYVYPESAEINSRDKNIVNAKNWQSLDEKEFIEKHLSTSLKNLVKQHLSIDDFPFSIKLLNPVIVPVIHSSSNPLHSFKKTFPAIKCNMEIESFSEILNLIYDIGIGARRSEGFGMLEVV